MMSSQMQLGKFSAAPSLVRRQRATLRTQAVATQAPAIAATKRVQLGDSDLMVSGALPLHYSYRVWLPCTHQFVISN